MVQRMIFINMQDYFKFNKAIIKEYEWILIIAKHDTFTKMVKENAI